MSQDYFENRPGMTYFDGLLSRDGRAYPLILQIAEEFRRKFPAIFQDYRLMQCRAYKYDSGLKGYKPMPPPPSTSRCFSVSART